MRPSFGAIGVLAYIVAPVRSATRLFAQEIEYCSTQQIIIVDRFDIVFYPSNSSVTFNVVANSVQNAVNADVSFAIDAYGLSPIEYNLDLCSVANGVLCPLPAYSFNGQASYFIPPNYISQIPSIAYSIPDLEASATVRIVDTSTDQEVACLTVFLSNGKTTRHAYVSWIVGAFIILATLVALIHPYYPLAKSRSAPDYRLLGMVNWAQFMALTGMISVHYPQALVSFAQNFAWTWGLIYIEPFQRSAEATATKTGGSLNVTKNAIEIGDSLLTGRRSANGALQIPAVDLSTAMNATFGMDRYLQEISLHPATAFANSLVVFLILAAILLVLCGLIGSSLGATKSNRRQKSDNVEQSEKEKTLSDSTDTASTGSTRRKQSFRDYMSLNALRWLLVAIFPLLALAIYTFRIGEVAGAAFTAIAAIFFVLLLGSMLALGVSIKRSIKKEPDGVDGLYASQRQRRRYGALFHQYKRKMSWYAGLLVAMMVLRAIFIGAAQGQAWAQIVPLLLIELVLFVCICTFKPHSAKGSNVLDGFMCALRVVCIGLHIAFVPDLNVNRIVVTVLGIVIIAIESIGFLILAGIFVVHTITGIMWFFRVRPDKLSDPLPKKRSTSDKKAPADPVSALQLQSQPSQEHADGSNRSSATLFDPAYQHTKGSPDRSSPTVKPWPFVPTQSTGTLNLDRPPAGSYDSAHIAQPGAPPLPPGASFAARPPAPVQSQSYTIAYNPPLAPPTFQHQRSASYDLPAPASVVSDEPRPSSMYVAQRRQTAQVPFPASLPNPYAFDRAASRVSSVVPPALQSQASYNEQASYVEEPQHYQDSPRLSPSAHYLAPDPAWDQPSPRSVHQGSPTTPRLPSPMTPRRVPLPHSPYGGQQPM